VVPQALLTAFVEVVPSAVDVYLTKRGCAILCENFRGFAFRAARGLADLYVDHVDLPGNTSRLSDACLCSADRGSNTRRSAKYVDGEAPYSAS